MTNLFVLFLLVFLCIQAHSKCLNLLQNDGYCTNCPPGYSFDKSNCYPPIPHCSQYMNNLKCLSCQYGYELNAGKCQQSKIFSTINEIQTVQFGLTSNDKNNPVEIKIHIDPQFEDLVQKSNTYFRSKKKSVIDFQSVNQIDVLETEDETFITIVYNGINQLYFGICSLRNNGNLSEIFFTSFSVLTKITTLSQIQKNVRDKYKQILKQSYLSKIESSNRGNIQNYKLIFKTLSSQQYSVDVTVNIQIIISDIKLIQKQPTVDQALRFLKLQQPELININLNNNSIVAVETGFIYQFQFTNGAVVEIQYTKVDRMYHVKSYQIQVEQSSNPSKQLAGSYRQILDFNNQNFMQVKKFLIDLYSQLRGVPIIKAQQQIVAGTNFRITYQDKTNSYVATVFRSLAGQINVVELLKNGVSVKDSLKKLNNTSTPMTLLGGFQPIDLNLDKNLPEIKKYIWQRYPELQGAEIQIGGVQIVSGLNYLLMLSKNQDNYKVTIHRSLQGQLQIKEIYKNGNKYPPQLNADKPNFETDPIFSAAYTCFKNKVGILNFLAIQQVSKVTVQDEITFTIIYSPTEFGIVKYKTSNKVCQVLSYVLDGIPIYSESTSKSSTNTVSVTRVLDYTLKLKPQLFKNAIIKSSQTDMGALKFEFVADTGIYSAIAKGNFTLTSIIQLSSLHCASLTKEQIKSDPNFLKVKAYVETNINNLKDYNIKQVLFQVLSSSTRFKILYMNENFKKISVMVSSTNLNVLKLISTAYLDNGYQVLDDDPLINQARNIAESNWGELKKSMYLLCKKNTTNLKLIYGNQNNYYQIITNLKIQNPILSTYSQKKANLPPKYNLSSIVDLKLIQSNQFFLASNKKILEIFSKYLTDSTVVLLSVQNRSDCVVIKTMYHTSLGIFQSISSYNKITKIVTILSFKLTSITVWDVGICSNSQFAKNYPQCQKCDDNEMNQVNQCFKKIDGCKLQIGERCLICEAEFELVDYQCIKDCNKLFS